MAAPLARTSFAALAVLGVTVFSASAAAQGTGVRFTAAPARALQGSPAMVSVSVSPARSRCALAVRYADGSTQPGLRAVAATAGRATWRWVIPAKAGAGAARAKVMCGRAGSATRTIIVVGAVEPPKITVRQEGFSIRLRPTSAGISYGLVLANDSAKLDALKVSVLINFVDASDRLVGTTSERIEVIGAQSTFGVGGSETFPAAAIVDHLETVVQVEGHRPRALRVPATANLRILPSRFEPQWVGSIEGEVINDHPQFFLRGAKLSAVVFDAAGNVVGGSDGSVGAVLPPGAREFYKLTSGLSNVPVEKAASAQLWLEPRYSPA